MNNLLLSPIPLSQLELLIIKSVENVLLRKNEEGIVDPNPDQWMSLNDAVDYDPLDRTKATWYGMVSKGTVPYYKEGKSLMFLKSEIDAWFKSGRRKTNAEIEAEAANYIRK